MGVDRDAAFAAITGPPVIRGDLFELPVRDDSVDAVVAWQVLCQFPPSRARAALGECHRVLKAQGLLVLSGCAGSGAFASERAEGPLVWEGPWLAPEIGFVPITSTVLRSTSGAWHARWLVLARKADPP
jgi:predicted SAM-dependent methyltransferase